VDAKQITIVGTGLLGASLGLALKARGFDGRIVGLGRRLVTVERAKATGAVDVATDQPDRCVPQSDLVVLALPLSGFATVFQQIAPHDHDQLIISDVGSTKLEPVTTARKYLPQPNRFCGAHPMAGKERSGPEAADAELFVGKPCIVTPETDTADGAVQMVESLWRTVGMSVLRMPAQEHDRCTALTSHLPHAAAVLLVQVAAQHGGWNVASTGFTSTTRLASSNPPMRTDIMLANRRPLIEAIDAFSHSLTALRKALDHADEAAIRRILETSKTARDNWLNDPNR